MGKLLDTLKIKLQAAVKKAVVAVAAKVILSNTTVAVVDPTKLKSELGATKGEDNSENLEKIYQ